RLSLGMGGMHGSYAANMALYDSDLLINIGARFDDRLTGNLKKFAPQAKVAHIDIDPAEIGKNVSTDIPIVADAKKALEALLKRNISMPAYDEWQKIIQGNSEKYRLCYEQNDEAMSPQWLMKSHTEYTNGEAVVATDVGHHQMLAAQFYGIEE